MKKLQLFIILLVVLILFAYADNTLNVPDGIDLPNIPDVTKLKKDPDQAHIINHPNVTQAVLDSSGLTQSYSIEKRTRTTALYENFDLKGISNISAYANILVSAEDKSFPLYIYEIHGPKGQGKITYLNVKLKLIDQLGTSAGINETGSLGFNSLFYNDEGNPNTGFLLSQIGDIVFGFKYSKSTGNAFDSVKIFVETYMSEVTN